VSEKKCTVCGERRFVEVEKDDGLTVTTKIARKQLRYMPLLKRLFISKNTARHMRWHKEGVRENPNVMVHPAEYLCEYICDCEYVFVYELCVYLHEICFFCKCQFFKKQNFVYFLKFVMSDGLAGSRRT
jgi:hypothetical protein